MLKVACERLLVLLLLAALPASLLGGDLGANLSTSGSVLVDGAAPLRGGAVLAGQRIDVGSASAASLTMTGGAIQVAPESSVVFAPTELVVRSGGAVVRSDSLRSRIHNLLVEPTTERTRYAVAEREQKVYIAALEGAVRLNDGRQQKLLAAGEAFAVPIERAHDASASSAPEPQAGGAAAGAGNAFVSNGLAIAIGVAAAAAGTGLTIGLVKALAANPSSPHRP